MLVDSGFMTGPSTIVAENVTQLPREPEDNAMVYLTEDDDTFVPGLYIFIEQAWMILSTGETVT